MSEEKFLWIDHFLDLLSTCHFKERSCFWYGTVGQMSCSEANTDDDVTRLAPQWASGKHVPRRWQPKVLRSYSSPEQRYKEVMDCLTSARSLTATRPSCLHCSRSCRLLTLIARSSIRWPMLATTMPLMLQLPQLLRNSEGLTSSSTT